MELFEIEVNLRDGAPAVLATHNAPHGDDMVAMEEIIVEGTAEFVAKYAVDGVIQLGFGGGPFDDHVGMKKGLPKKKSCSILVAEALGIKNDPRWKKILKYINRNDTDGSTDQTDIATLLKHAHRQFPEDQDDHVNWFLAAIFAKWHDYKNGNFTIKYIAQLMRENEKARGNTDPDKFLEKGQKTYDLNREYFQRALAEIKKEKFRGGILVDRFNFGSNIVKVAAIHSNNYRMGGALRSDLGLGADIVVIKSSSGHGYVGSSKKLGIKLIEPIAVIRYSEQLMKKDLNLISHIPVTNWDTLREPGTVEGIGEWHFDTLMNPQMLYNGTPSYPDTPPTNLSLQQLFDAVLIGLDQNLFNAKYKFWCQRGYCEIGNKCRYYAFGLDRCRKNKRVKSKTGTSPRAGFKNSQRTAAKVTQLSA